MLEFKDKLKKYRIDNNLTQEQLADILHVSRGAISKYETGRSYPSVEILQEVAVLLNTSVDELLSKSEITKETIKVSNKIKVNRHTTIILSILIFIVLFISIMAIITASKNNPKKYGKNDDLVFCGLICIASDTHAILEFNEKDFLDHKYFGLVELYEGDTGIKTVMNCEASVIDFNGGVDYKANIYLSKKVKMISYYFIYYDKIEEKYKPKINSTLLASEGLLRTVDENECQNKIYSFEFNYIWIDELLEMKIMEFDLKGNLIKETKYNNEEDYIINENTLYLVIEEKLIDQNGNTYYNREIIFNEEINNTYYHVLKIPNENLTATQSLLIKKK